jgi:hypothetical protein
MSLLELPPEILTNIFEFVGAANLHSDVSRITVNKQWSKFAHTACFQDLCITQKTLRGLVSSPYMEASPQPVTDILRSISVALIGFDEWSSMCPKTYTYPRLPWEAKLREDLDFLTTITNNSRKLRSISIKAAVEPRVSSNHAQRDDYVYISTMRSYLSATNLTHLDLDLVGSRLISSRADRGHYDNYGRTHICPHIAKYLTTLQTLRLRLRDICPTALSLQQGATKLRLTNVIVNLCLDGVADELGFYSYYDRIAKPCGRGPGVIFPAEEIAVMEEQAQMLVSNMAAPEMVRVLSATRAFSHVNAFDALTGQTLKLSNEASVSGCWDTYEEFVEPGPESEAGMETDDLSDFDFDGDDAGEIVQHGPEDDAGEVSDFWDFASDGDDGPS